MILGFVDPRHVDAYRDAFKALIQEAVRDALEQAISKPNGLAHEQLLTPDELAQRLQVPVSWVYEQSRQGNLPTHRLGRYIRFRLAEVLASRAAQERATG